MSESKTIAEAACAYARFFERLARDDLDALDGLCAPRVRFRDPFNETTGVDAFRRVLENMYEDVRDPRFTVSDRALSGNVCYLRWRFDYRFKDGCQAPVIDGVSEVHFDPQGRVTAHLDYWDAAGQLYEHLPLIGPLMRWLRRRLAARH